MNRFRKKNLDNIKDIFEDKTGVSLKRKRSAWQPFKIAMALAAVIACLTMTAFASGLFSSLDGDDLSLSAVYEGNGIVSVTVENRSNKELHFQANLKLMKWTTSEEIEPNSDLVDFDGTYIPAHSSGVMTIDLSGAYDIAALEEPLDNDWYYLVLTNNNFVFGQDWMCSISFSPYVEAEPDITEPAAPPEIDKSIIENISDSLKFYFENVSFDIEDRLTMTMDYVNAYTELFSQFEGNIIPSVSSNLLVDDPEPGVVFDDSVAADEQYLLIGEHEHSSDINFKLLATEGEHALVLSAYLPLAKYPDSSRDLPLFYIFTYEKAAAGSDDYAFIYGRLLSFSELEQYKVYEDDEYVCYEVSSMIYSDLTEYVQSFADQNTDVRFDDKVMERIEKIYDYYKENLKNLFYYR